jgi:hypothetical protein
LLSSERNLAIVGWIRDDVGADVERRDDARRTVRGHDDGANLPRSSCGSTSYAVVVVLPSGFSFWNVGAATGIAGYVFFAPVARAIVSASRLGRKAASASPP